MLLNAHPLKQLLNYMGGSIGLYLLWIHKPLLAAIFGLGFVLLGSLLSLLIGKYDPYEIVKTSWGKTFLHYTSLVGFTLYLASHILIPVAFWFHNFSLALIGVGLLIVGYFFPPIQK
jgi:hypothetical protein